MFAIVVKGQTLKVKWIWTLQESNEGMLTTWLMAIDVGLGL